MAGDGGAVDLPAKNFDAESDSVVLRAREGDDDVQRNTADPMVTATSTHASENSGVNRGKQCEAPAVKRQTTGAFSCAKNPKEGIRECA